MKIYTVTVSCLVTQSEPQLYTEVYTDLDEAQAAFLRHIPCFTVWEDMISFMVRFANDKLTKRDLELFPGIGSGSPQTCWVKVNPGDVFWFDDTLEETSVRLQELEI